MNKYKFVALFVVCCGLPFLAAKLVLEMGWFNAGVSNKGQWQQREVFLLDASADKAHWRLAVPGENCQQACQQALYTVKQLYVGLGRKQQHVLPVWLAKEPTPANYPMFQQAPAIAAVPATLADKIMLIDHQGLVLLTYPMPSSEKDMAPTAKAIRYDLMKLLNYDRTSV